TVLNPLDEVASATLAHGHYIVLRLKEPLTPEQIARSALIAQEMVEDNIEWKTKINARRAKVINSLPMPASWKKWLIWRFTATGYDWLGLFTGRIAKHNWTCIAACLELDHRLGIKTDRYGTGLLGLGTGVFDPIMP